MRVSLVMIDSEHFRTKGGEKNASLAWDAAITAKHTRTFRLAKTVFPDVLFLKNATNYE